MKTVWQEHNSANLEPNQLKHMRKYEMIKPILNDKATKAYNQGVREGVIKNTKQWIICTVLQQDVITYGQYSFYCDLIEGDVTTK